MAQLVKVVAAATLITLPAAAQDTAMWAGTGCQLVPVEGEAWVAVARCVNVLTYYQPWTEGKMTAGGITVHLHGPDDVPDTFTLTPPDGFVAVPPVLVLDEDTQGVVVIREYLGF